MNVQKRLPTTLTILIYLASVAVLAMSPAYAADTAAPVTTGQGAGHGPGHHGAFNGTVNATLQAERFQSLITKLGQQGVDTTQVQADLTAGNTDAVKAWFQNYAKDHPMAFGNRTGMRPAMNATTMAGRFQSMITKLGQQGTDISQVQADLAAGNMDAVIKWIGSYFQGHPMSSGNRTGMKPAGMRPAVNATAQAERLQSMITKLGQQGVDVSQVQADLTAGNTTAVMQWFQQYRKDHPTTAVNAAKTRTGTGSSGTFSGFFPGHRMNAGNWTAMNRTAGHHAWSTVS